MKEKEKPTPLSPITKPSILKKQPSKIPLNQLGGGSANSGSIFAKVVA